MEKEIERDIRKFVNVNKVAKEVKAQQWFALYSKDSENNLLITRNFILNLNSDQFWKIQCKLECKKLGVWFWMNKGDLIEDAPVTDLEIEEYFRLVNHSRKEILTSTLLSLEGFEVYDASGRYIGIRSSYFEMLNGMLDMYEINSSLPLVAAGVHVIIPNREIGSEYLVDLLD